MKNKGLLIACLASVLTLASATASMAAGWAAENGQWVYYDNDGIPVTSAWKRGADNQWRYLNSRGQMATNSWVDEEYYVDSDGAMAAGKWMKLNSNSRSLTAAEHWYYFQDNGKVVTNSWKKIDNKWYHFDADGAMETGWMDDNMSYAKDDGVAVTGWQRLSPPEDEGEEPNPFEEDKRRWYYFSSAGKKFVPELKGDAKCGEKRIDGAYYCFNSRGAMQTGWAYVGGASAAFDTINGYRFYGSNGQAVTGWYSAEPPAGLRGYENDVEWFYFTKGGVPKSGPAKGSASTSDFLKVNGKTYLFNELGIPVAGLQKVYAGKSSGDYAAYYFEPGSCAMMSGKVDVTESDGTKGQYYFMSGGKGYTGVYNGSLYYLGKMQAADASLKFEVITFTGTSGTRANYVVNTVGKIMKSAVRDSGGTLYTPDSNGILAKINGETVSAGMTFSDPKEPSW